MTDIVERLKNDCPCSGDIGCADALCQEAADEITRLRDENERLRWMVRRLQERTRQLIQDNQLLAHDDTAEWGLDELMKDVGYSDEH